MPHAEYSKLDAVNWSTAKELAVSPKQYQFALTNQRDETAALRFGLALHAIVLEPEAFPTKFVTYRESKTTGEGAKKRWQAFQDENADKTILSIEEHDRVVAAGNAILTHPLARRYLCDGLREQVITWNDEATGIACRGRVDYAGTHLVEVKTAAQLDPRIFAAQAARLLYPEQCAFYRRGLRANGIEVDDTPILVVVENCGPHDVLVYRLPGDVMLAADEKVSALLALLKKCRDTDTWPGRSEEELDFQLPAWARSFDDGLDLVVGGEEVRL
jgi:hypothetical protein